MTDKLQQGREAMDIGDYAEAEAYYRAVHEAQPDNSEACFWLAEALAEQG